MDNETRSRLLATARATRNPVLELRELKLRGEAANTNGSGVYRRRIEGAGVYVGTGTSGSVEKVGR